MHLKISSAKWRPFCPGAVELRQSWPITIIGLQAVRHFLLIGLISVTLEKEEILINPCWVEFVFICIFYHSSTLRYHRKLKSFLQPRAPGRQGPVYLVYWIPWLMMTCRPLSINKKCLTSIEIPIIKIRQSHGSLIWESPWLERLSLCWDVALVMIGTWEASQYKDAILQV